MDVRAPEPAPIDRYVVLEYLAEGGMGAIYLGKKMGAGGFEKQVVLKQLLPEFTRQAEFIDLFLREARLSATLDHANIIHTIDLVTAGDDYFIVMEYLDGADLRTLLKRAKKRQRKISSAAGIYIARELLSAMAYAHNKIGPDGLPLRLIHRDISPSNILVSGSGEVKLTDFGIAKASTHNSVLYRVKGKVGYMSPEQAASDPLDARSDLYSLAVCLYEMITGERLFVNIGLTTSAEEMYGQPVPLISHKVAGLPPELDKVMLKALSRDPAHRYQTAGELQDALLRCAHRHGLMMSAPELAEHLREACGNPGSWRDDRADAESARAAGGGTEMYDIGELDGGGTEQLDLGGDDEPILSHSDIVSMADGGGKPSREARARTSITRLTELKGIQLTSLINMAATSDDGAAPLVDLDDLAASPNLSASGERRPAAEGSPRPRPSGAAPAAPAAPGLPGVSPRASEPDRGPRRPVTVGDITGVLLTAEDRLPAPKRSPSRPESIPPAARAPRPRRATSLFVRRPWIVLGVILLAGVATAVAVGLSGPTLDGGKAAPPEQLAPPAPAAAPTIEPAEPAPSEPEPAGALEAAVAPPPPVKIDKPKPASQPKPRAKPRPRSKPAKPAPKPSSKPAPKPRRPAAR
jgi:serine/threonine-protein kinase